MNLERALAYSLIIIFINACMQQGMIFGKLRLWLDARLPEVLQKPLYDCIICMSGIYTVGLWIFTDWSNIHLADAIGYVRPLILLIATVGGLNVVLSPFVELTIFQLIKRVTDADENTE